MLFGSSNWENVRDAKQAKRSAEIDKYSASLPTTAATAASDADILSSNATEIVAGIKAKRWTATGVLECFIRAAIRVQRASNAVTEIMFEEALEAAKALDQGFGSTGELVGECEFPLFSINWNASLPSFVLTMLRWRYSRGGRFSAMSARLTMALR